MKLWILILAIFLSGCTKPEFPEAPRIIQEKGKLSYTNSSVYLEGAEAEAWVFKENNVKIKMGHSKWKIKEEKK